MKKRAFDKLPFGNISSSEALGASVRKYRKQHGWRIEDVSGIANVGARFISEFERGKETAELGKVLKVLEAMGLEVVCDLAAGWRSRTMSSRHDRS